MFQPNKVLTAQLNISKKEFFQQAMVKKEKLQFSHHFSLFGFLVVTSMFRNITNYFLIKVSLCSLEIPMRCIKLRFNGRQTKIY